MDEKKLVADTGIRHIGIIMDGNGRWAKKRGLPRNFGHSQGAKTFKKCVDDCIELGVPCVTFYAFSTENWSRPTEEVNSIMKLFDAYLDDIRKMDQKNIIMKFIGDLTALSPSIRRKIAETEATTANNTGMVCCIAVNYGGKNEILNAAKQIALECRDNGLDPQKLDESVFSDYLYTKGLPDVDMIIRPSGEMRSSNFLIWQAAYAEFVSMDVLWPDFSRKDLIAAIQEYGKRNRRFGGV